MSDWADGVFNPTTSGGGNAVLSKLLGAPSIAGLTGSALGAAAGSTATSSSNGNKFETSNDNSGWNVNFGSGSITSSAEKRDALAQWVTIASGIAALLVVLKVIKG